MDKQKLLKIFNEQNFLSNVERKVLLLMYKQDSNKSTAPQMAQLLGYTHYAPVNKIIGRLGNKIARRLKLKEKGYEVIFNGEYSESSPVAFIWTLKQEIKDILNQTNWDWEKILNTPTGTLVSENDIDILVSSNTIFYGPPGTGKTFETFNAAKKLALQSEKETSMDEKQLYKERVKFITFHPSFSYEDFVEGIRPNPDAKAGESSFTVRPGIFKLVCADALQALQKTLQELNDSDDEVKALGVSDWKSCDLCELEQELPESAIEAAPKYVLIIDEINRGNISKIFGELITLIEDDKRLGKKNAMAITLPYSQKPFGVPPNLYIIGTMNTADRSIAQLDVALRRRFQFQEFPPQLDDDDFAGMWEENANAGEVMPDCLTDALEFFRALNANITRESHLGRDKRIGHAYLLNVDDEDSLAAACNAKIFPLLTDYCYGDYETLSRLLGGAANIWLDEKEKAFKKEIDIDDLLEGFKSLRQDAK